jgi:hypothetical protein
MPKKNGSGSSPLDPDQILKVLSAVGFQTFLEFIGSRPGTSRNAALVAQMQSFLDTDKEAVATIFHMGFIAGSNAALDIASAMTARSSRDDAPRA